MSSTMRSVGMLLLVGLTVVAVSVGGWFLYWSLAQQAQTNQYHVNTHSQQYQASLMAQERNLVVGINTAGSDGQRTAFTQQFCALYPQLDPAPADLQSAHDSLC